MTAAVEAGDAAQHAVHDAVDVAVRRVHGAEDPLGDGAHELVEVARAAGERAELDELVEDPVAPVHLLEQRGVLQGVGGHLAQPADEVQILGEIARLVVGEFHHAEHTPVRHERHGQLRLIAPLLQGVAALSGQEGIVERGGDGDLAGLDGAPAAGVATQRQDHAVPLHVEAAAVVADEAAQRVALDGVDVRDRRVREFGETFDDGVEDLVGAEAGGVLETRLDDQPEVRGCVAEGER